MTKEIFVKMALDAWNSKIKEADTLFNLLSDEQLKKECAPNRNRGIYLLGHLSAVNDHMLPLLGMGEKLYPQLTEAFISNADKAKEFTESASDLRNAWKKINDELALHFNNMSADAWFEKHNSVSTEDFQKEPHRNKLNVIISRTNHLAYHIGQLVFLKD